MKICLPKSKWYSKSKVKINVLNLSNKVKIWDLSKDHMSLAEVGRCYGKNEPSTHSAALNHIAWVCAVFPQWRSAWNQIPVHIPRMYCNLFLSPHGPDFICLLVYLYPTLFYKLWFIYVLLYIPSGMLTKTEIWSFQSHICSISWPVFPSFQVLWWFSQLCCTNPAINDHLLSSLEPPLPGTYSGCEGGLNWDLCWDLETWHWSSWHYYSSFCHMNSPRCLLFL
jgi:hypothetical protein